MINALDTDPGNVDLLSESSQTARGLLINSISYSLRGSQDEVGLLSGEDEEY